MIAGCSNENSSSPLVTGAGSTTNNTTASSRVAAGPVVSSSVSNTADSHGKVETVTNGPARRSVPLAASSASTKLAATAAKLTSISIMPANPSAALGVTQQLAAIGHYSNGTTSNLTTVVSWKSINTSIASVSITSDSHGLIHPVAVGSTMISAAYGDVTGDTPFTVTAAILSTLFVTPVNSKTPLGVLKRLAATGVYSDGGVRNLTNTAIWKTEDGAVATVSNALGSNGQATPVAAGSTKLSATVGMITASLPFEVTEAKLVSILVKPNNPIAYPGFSEQLTATGSFTDGSTKNITDTVSWKAANSSIAVISNTSGSNGTITPVTIGTTPVTASLAGITGSTTLTVSKITTVPKAPTGVTINSSALNRTGQLAVSWPAVSGATSYNIYIYTAESNKAARVIFYVTSPYINTFNPGTYYFIVTAVNSFGESAPSDPVNSTVLVQKRY